jgi:hypothetical protein
VLANIAVVFAGTALVGARWRASVTAPPETEPLTLEPRRRSRSRRDPASADLSSAHAEVRRQP